MSQESKRLYSINKLLEEDSRYRGMSLPDDEYEQKRILRSLLNIRPPKRIEQEFLTIQNEYLQRELEQLGITDLESLKPLKDDLYLWQGDITLLRCGAIVNAANSGMTGYYVPCHSCIDNCIHTYAGIQLRLECSEIMKQQGYNEPTGRAKITKA